MKKTIQFSKFFMPAAFISLILITLGIVGFVTKGFTLGVDFKPGLIQEIQFVSSAFNIRWTGTTNAILSSDRSGMYVVVSGSGIENQTHSFSYSEYNSIGSLTEAMKEQLDELDVSIKANENVNSQWILILGSTQLNPESFTVIHYLDPASGAVDISDVRTSLAGFGQSVSVQNIGAREERKFMIRVEEDEEDTTPVQSSLSDESSDGQESLEADEAADTTVESDDTNDSDTVLVNTVQDRITSEKIIGALESFFGEGQVALMRLDRVDSRFSKDLTDQAGFLLAVTLLVILIYVSIRFKFQYAVGAVVAIIYDAVIVVSFVIWSQMEFTTSTIAAILTILGYSINNTIVVFDRVRESRRIYPDNSFTDVLNISLTNVLGRSIITTFTTMLAVLFLFIFAKGAMKDFALALIVGMTSGLFTTLFISTGIVNLLEKAKQKKKKQPR